MFTKQSRYYALPDVVIEDAAGRSRQAKSLRLLPAVTGDVQHTIEANDRLDQLAYKYYQRSRNWWHINDANPDFLSPLALLGKEPILTVSFHLTWNDADGVPPWALLRNQLQSQPGVIDVHVADDLQLAFNPTMVAGEAVLTATSMPDRAIRVTFNSVLADPNSLMDIIMAYGFQRVQAQEQTRVGKPLIIPPASSRPR